VRLEDCPFESKRRSANQINNQIKKRDKSADRANADAKYSIIEKGAANEATISIND